MTYQELQVSLRLLGVPERATLGEIRARHRELVKRHHPDTGSGGDGERIKLINAAYRIVSDYLKTYRFSFSEQEFYDQNPEERLRRQFEHDPHWGNR